MAHVKRCAAMILLALVVLSWAGCGSPTAEPVAILPTATRAVAAAASSIPTEPPNQVPERTADSGSERAPASEQSTFRDDFDGALAEGWTWHQERPTHWSLTEVPGSLRLLTVPGKEWINVLLRDMPAGDWEISTRVTIVPTENFAGAMLCVFQDDRNALTLGRAYCDLDWCSGDAIYFDQIQDAEFVGDNFGMAVEGRAPVHLRLRRQGLTYTASYSLDGEDWTVVGEHEAALPSARVGLVTQKSETKSFPADFDFFEMSILSADGPAPTQAPPPTRTPTRTPAPTRTRVPTPTRAPTRTPTPTPCLPGAAFVANVTVPDGTSLETGTPFIKTWRMQSDGCARWPAGSTLAFVSGDRLGAPESVPVPDTPLDGSADPSVEMVAPDAAGTYQGNWQMRDPDGTPFGDRVHVQVTVTERPPRRLATGTIVWEAGARNGRGQLEIGNELDLDAVAVLSKDEGAFLFAVYILNHNSYTITGIPDGTYDLYFTVGEDWDGQRAAFTRKRRLSQFDDPLAFASTETTYSGWSVTLHPVAGGTASTENVPEGEFPDLKCGVHPGE